MIGVFVTFIRVVYEMMIYMSVPHNYEQENFDAKHQIRILYP